MKTVATPSIQNSISTRSLNKLLWWSLLFHLVIFSLFWNTQPNIPVRAGGLLSVALSSNTRMNPLPVTAKDVPSKTNRKSNESTENITSKPLPKKKLLALSARQKTEPVHKENIAVKKKLSENLSQTTTLPEKIANPKQVQNISAETTSRLQASLGKHLSKYFHYPHLARRKGWQGQVLLGLRVEGNGQLSHIRLTQSSGYATLDNAALDSLRKLAYLPKAKGWLKNRSHDMVIPIEYRLIDG